MPEYTVMTVVSVAAVVAAELLWFRTGIFRTAQYWISMAIVFAFQILVDGWLTKLSDPIVIYDPQQMLGLRAPWDIPVEDFGFGFTMVTLAILIWRRLTLVRTRPQLTRTGETDLARTDPDPTL
jgi:lycopene cyclase domain-containing protein